MKISQNKRKINPKLKQNYSPDLKILTSLLFGFIYLKP